MASAHRLTGAANEQPADAVGGYMTDLAAHLLGPRRARADVLAEIRDGLDEATTRRVVGGIPADAAVHAAIDEFGSPATVAAAFAGELGTVYARRTLLAFIFTGPLVGVWWLLLLSPRPWRPDPVALVAAIPTLPIVAAATALSLITLAITGRTIRWLPESTPAWALTAACAVGVACITGDFAALFLLAAHSIATPNTLSTALAVAAVTATVIRLACSGRAVLRSATIRRRLPESALNGRR